MRTYDARARSALAELDAHIDVALADAAWSDALAARWAGTDVWLHGDFPPGNLLLELLTIEQVLEDYSATR